jgi:hypothetical protein
MIALIEKFSKNNRRLVPAVALASIVLFASWMSNVNGGYFVGEWALVALVLATPMLVAPVAGVLHSARSQWSFVTIVYFALYTAWTFLSLLWAPNRGDAWLGAGQTLLYLLTFWTGVCLAALGTSRRWALITPTLGPATIAAFTLLARPSRVQVLVENNRLIESVGYCNRETPPGEATTGWGQVRQAIGGVEQVKYAIGNQSKRV